MREAGHIGRTGFFLPAEPVWCCRGSGTRRRCVPRSSPRRRVLPAAYSVGPPGGDDTRSVGHYGLGMSLAAASPRTPGRAFWTSTYLLPIALGAFQVVATHFAGMRQPEHQELDALGIILILVGAGALTIRHRYPVQVLGFVLIATLVYVLLDYARGPIFLSLVVALVTTVMRGHRLAAVTALVVGYSSFLWLPSVIDTEPPPELAPALGLAAWLIVLFTVSEIARSRRERALQLLRTEAEEARRRAGEERLRIARELHDVLAHNISLINVQAGVALHLIDEQPQQARTALSAIKDASNEALGELRSVLDILREGYEIPPRSPTSGLTRLDDLVAKTEAAGLKVTTRVEGRPRPLPPGVDLAAFRIVQEALTNVTRHAGDAQAEIRIIYGERDLIVQIDDDGGGPALSTSSGGKGISGMRERAAALDGDLEVGPREGGGFRVRARLPLPSDGSEVTT
jgi:signal transduction histidine kinase